MGDLILAPAKDEATRVQSPLSEGVLTREQGKLLEALAESLSPEQARWISGYFAGLDAGLMRNGSIEADPFVQPQGRTLTVLYGTETGNSREVARLLETSAKDRGLAPVVADLADYNVRKLKDEQDILFIVSTYGEGDPPQPSVAFFEFLEGPRAPRLEGIRYSVLALGDSTYEKYCEAGKRIDRRLDELGATSLAERVDCDIDFDDAAAEWTKRLLDLLGERAQDAPALFARPISSKPAPVAAYDKRNPFAATVLENIRITGRHSTKETRHVELDLSGSGLSYKPGDALGFVASNEARVVEELLAATSLDPDSEVTVKNSAISLAAALSSRFEITVASPRFIEQWAKLSASADLAALVGPDKAAERVRFLEQNHAVDIIRRFPVNGLEPDKLLAGLRPLQPRLYSISSSQSAVGDEVHLTVAPVRYQLHGTYRGGVASTEIADRLEMGNTVPVYVQENPHFRLPGDDVPVIMIGPGTGIAPFRAFLQEREIRSAAGQSWLFFGERNLRSDFLYQLEWQRWLKADVLSRLDVAFSRDTREKIYVQHRMLERSRELYEWLQEGAHIYVCGDEKAMARDVHDALIAVVAKEASISSSSALDYVAKLTSEHRYHRDVY